MLTSRQTKDRMVKITSLQDIINEQIIIAEMYTKIGDKFPLHVDDEMVGNAAKYGVKLEKITHVSILDGIRSLFKGQ